MPEDKTIKGMVNSVMENQKKACENLADVLSGAGEHLASGDLEIIAQTVTMMAAAKKNLEMMADAVKKATEGSADNPKVVQSA